MMESALEEMDGHDPAALTLVSEAVLPYVLTVGTPDDVEGQVETLALVVMRRTGAFLLAIPEGALDVDFLEEGMAGDANRLFGPYTIIEVPGVVLDGGVVSPTGTMIRVVLVDCLDGLTGSLRLPSGEDGVVVVFDADDPLALPAADALLSAAANWISLAGEGRTAFYSAESATPTSTPRKAPKAKRKPVPAGDTPTGDGPKPRRVTNAALAENLDGLMAAIPSLTSQMTSLMERQKVLETQLTTSQTRSILSRPLGGSLDLPQASLPLVTAQLDPPPKTQQRRSPGLLETAAVQKPLELLELEAEKAPMESWDALARAVYAQSQALTALVGQIASAQADPLSDLSSSGGGIGSKGAVGRAKLQGELAQHKGVFYQSVLQSMSRRMAPTSPMEASSQAMLDRGLSATRYLERFGGYGKHRELGHIQFQVMTAMDHLMADNLGGARDTVALLAVMLEQMVLDGGRMEVAGLLCLQEDVPSSVFTNRQLASTSRTRSFAPLADQRWITVALQYLREMDVIETKRQEFASNQRASGGGFVVDAEDPRPKPKAKAKYRGRGRGRGGQANAEEAA